MSALHEPFVLSTYTSTSRERNLKKYIPGAFVSSHRRPERSEEYVTVSVQSDGIHILDVDNIHPVASNTLGPSSSFSCPPLTIPSSSKHKWMTYAVGSASTNSLSSDPSDRTLWSWQSDAQSSENIHRKQTILPEGQRIRSLQACPDLSGRVLAFSSVGTISVVDAENLQTRTIFVPKASRSEFVNAWVFSRAQSSFGDRQNGALVVLLLSEEPSSTRLRVLVVDEADSISQLQEQEINIPAKSLLSASCSDSGFITLLEKDGSWSSYQLSSSLSFEQETSIKLSNFPFYAPPKSLADIPHTSSVALTSSHVLFASLVSAQQIVLHIWDLRFSVLLASQTVAVPSGISNAQDIYLRLTSGSSINASRTPDEADAFSNQTYLMVSSVPSLPSSRETIDSSIEYKATSVVFVIPYTVPKISTVAAAMGRGNLSKKWISSTTSSSGGVSASSSHMALGSSPEMVNRGKMFSNLKIAVEEGRTQAAEALFANWAPKTVDGEVSITASLLDYNFVKELLEAILLPSSKSAGYPVSIVRQLLESHLVSSVMLTSSGGLLAALRAKADWPSIESAFIHVLDLTEIEIVQTLRVILAHQRWSSDPSADLIDTVHPDNMQVDVPDSLPVASKSESVTPLATYLSLIASYPTSQLPLLLAFRQFLQDPEDVTAVLKVLSDWLGRRTKLEMETGESRKLFPSKKDLKKTEQGVWVVSKKKNKGTPKGPNAGPPPLDRLTTLIQTVLDSSFLALVSHKPSHEVLTTIGSQLSPEMAFALAAQDLLGSLEPFAQSQERIIKNSLIPKEEKEKESQKQDWRQRQNRKSHNVDIGLYTLEELSL